MVLEGGSIHVDGEGSLLTTEQCLLHENRNPELSKIEIEENLKKTFGVTNIIWLKYGTDEGTDGHVDNVACFTSPGTVMAMTCNDKNDPYYDRLSENLEILKTARDSSGNPLNVIELEMSYKRIIPDDDEPCSYMNFYIANDAIVLPVFNDKKADNNAKNIIQTQFPSRKMICLDGTQILLGGGGVHCITQQQPRSRNG
jgi:agmatine deiminase